MNNQEVFVRKASTKLVSKKSVDYVGVAKTLENTLRHGIYTLVHWKTPLEGDEVMWEVHIKKLGREYGYRVEGGSDGLWELVRLR